jgi:hypothetical protein
MFDAAERPGQFATASLAYGSAPDSIEITGTASGLIVSPRRPIPATLGSNAQESRRLGPLNNFASCLHAHRTLVSIEFEECGQWIEMRAGQGSFRAAEVPPRPSGQFLFTVGAGHRDWDGTPGHRDTGTSGHRDTGTPGHRDTGTGTGRWDWDGTLGLGRDAGTGTGRWDWDGTLGLGRDNFARERWQVLPPFEQPV